MKLVFILALLIGFAGTLAGAHFAPGLKHARLPSNTTVVANGGRAEKFMIRLPADRIAAWVRMFRERALAAGVAAGSSDAELTRWFDLMGAQRQLKVLGIFVFLVVMTLFSIVFERKVVGRMQNRIGPNRVGPWGILQSLADGVKLAFKEEIIPVLADKPVYFLAPILSAVPAFLAFRRKRKA